MEGSSSNIEFPQPTHTVDTVLNKLSTYFVEDKAIKPVEQTKLGQRFEEFARVQEQVIEPLLSARPEEIAKLDPDAEASRITSGIESRVYQETARSTVAQYINLEKRVEQWLISSSDVTLPKELGIESEKPVRVARMHGGFAVYLAPQDFRHYLGLKVIQNGQQVIGEEDQNDLVFQIAQAGILLDASEIPQSLGLPEGVAIAIISDNRAADKAVFHEEQEVIGRYFDRAIGTDVGKLLDQNSESKYTDAQREQFRVITYDLAARILDGAGEITLTQVGITQQFASENVQDVSQIKAVLSKLNERLSGIDPKDRTELARIVRGGALRFEKLAEYLIGETYDKNAFQETEFSTDDFRGIVLQSDRKGRFVFNEATLGIGDRIIHQEIPYKVLEVIAQGGMGVVYKAQGADGKIVAIKELIFEAPEALISNEYVAPAMVDSLVESQRRQDFDPFKVHDDLINIVKGTTAEMKLTEIINEVLDQTVSTLLGPDGRPVYRGGRLIQFDPHTGQPRPIDDRVFLRFL